MELYLWNHNRKSIQIEFEINVNRAMTYPHDTWSYLVVSKLLVDWKLLKMLCNVFFTASSKEECHNFAENGRTRIWSFSSERTGNEISFSVKLHKEKRLWNYTTRFAGLHDKEAPYVHTGSFTHLCSNSPGSGLRHDKIRSAHKIYL